MVLQCGPAWGEAEQLIRCNLETSLATAMVLTLEGYSEIVAHAKEAISVI